MTIKYNKIYVDFKIRNFGFKIAHTKSGTFANCVIKNRMHYTHKTVIFVFVCVELYCDNI